MEERERKKEGIEKKTVSKRHNQQVQFPRLVPSSITEEKGAPNLIYNGNEKKEKKKLGRGNEKTRCAISFSNPLWRSG